MSVHSIGGWVVTILLLLQASVGLVKQFDATRLGGQVLVPRAVSLNGKVIFALGLLSIWSGMATIVHVNQNLNIVLVILLVLGASIVRFLSQPPETSFYAPVFTQICPT